MEARRSVEKCYTCNKNGKEYTIKRRYTVRADRIVKNDELDEYFKNNADTLKSNKKLKDIVDEYNNNHSKVSYAKFYLKYKSIFGYRKNRKQQEDKQQEHNEISTDDNDHLSESRETSEDNKW